VCVFGGPDDKARARRSRTRLHLNHSSTGQATSQPAAPLPLPLPLSLSACLPVSLPVSLPVYQSVSQSVSQSACLHVCLSVCLPLTLHHSLTGHAGTPAHCLYLCRRSLVTHQPHKGGVSKDEQDARDPPRLVAPSSSKALRIHRHAGQKQEKSVRGQSPTWRVRAGMCAWTTWAPGYAFLLLVRCITAWVRERR